MTKSSQNNLRSGEQEDCFTIFPQTDGTLEIEAEWRWWNTWPGTLQTHSTQQHTAEQESFYEETAEHDAQFAFTAQHSFQLRERAQSERILQLRTNPAQTVWWCAAPQKRKGFVSLKSLIRITHCFFVAPSHHPDQCVPYKVWILELPLHLDLRGGGRTSKRAQNVSSTILASSDIANWLKLITFFKEAHTSSSWCRIMITTVIY